MQQTKPWAVYHLEKVIAVVPTHERHDDGSPSCPCGPFLNSSLEPPVLLHKPFVFAHLRVPDAWPSPGRVE